MGATITTRVPNDIEEKYINKTSISFMKQKVIFAILLCIIILTPFSMAVVSPKTTQVDTSDLLGKSLDELIDILNSEYDPMERSKSNLGVKQQEILHKYSTATYTDEEGMEKAMKALYIEEITKHRAARAARAV
ncbi:MAG: hypothetical protein Q7U68_01045, partial [Candidatus Roizmanbacteria bacterium]|nr:hypothetical protein [Candidatus Roizmanbacteria bacterium]